MKTEYVRSTLSSGKARVFAIYFSALIGALFFVSILGQQTFRIEALHVRLNIQPATAGYTEVEIPPLATIKAKTHSTPIKISITLESIDLQQVQKMLDKKVDTGVVDTITQGLRAATGLFALKILVLSAAGGAFGVFLWQRRPGIIHLRGALAATLTIGLLLFMTFSTYNVKRFEHPEYNGALKMAPWVIGLAGETLNKIDTLNNKMDLLADNIYQLFNQIDQFQTYTEPQEGLVKVLHVSDIHNNPASMGYIQRIAGLFKVDMIIDTGDITDYGTPLESLLLEWLSGLKVPYFFVPGNHDSPETIKKMESIHGVKVLKGTEITISNLRIIGFPDPSSRSSGIEPPPLSMIPQYAGEIVKTLSDQKEKPDILAVHNHRIASLLAGTAPVVLFGHDHVLNIKEMDGSIMIDAGSSGAAGLR
ncbi:MAG: metallophosphoesterase family protein, partial [Desulfocucumaceae bacterium]